MRMRSAVFLALTTALPAAVHAQRGGGGGVSRPTARPALDMPDMPVLRAPSLRDVQELNPAWKLLDKRRKLALTDSQVAQLKAIEQRIADRDKPLLVTYDSVRRDFHPPEARSMSGLSDAEKAAMQPSDVELARPRMQLRVMQNIIGLIARERPRDVEATLAICTDGAQKKKAMDYLKDQDDDLARMLPPLGAPPGGAR